MPSVLLPSAAPARTLAERALSRAAGAPLLGDNAVELLIDGEAHYTAWLEAIRGARHRVLLENYIVRNDAVGHAFLDALSERARAGVFVAVLVDWMGCLGQSRGSFWAPLRAAGGHFRGFKPPRWGQSLGWVAITRNATEPAGSAALSRRGKSGSRSPVVRQLSANAASISATAGPCTATPVSRHGGTRRLGSPSHFSLMHTPERKPCIPSTTSTLRWSRLTQPSDCPNRGGLNTRKWPPAAPPGAPN
jgi:hypothetical protein